VPATKSPPVFRPLVALYPDPEPPAPPVEVLPPGQAITPASTGAPHHYTPDAEEDALRALAALGYSLSAALAWWVVSDIINALSGRRAP